MKKLIIAIGIIAGFSTSVNAQSTSEMKEKPKMEMKEHSCTSSCTKDHHMMMHGEMGHTCTDACKKMEVNAKLMESKEHTCTSSCTPKKHMMMHGEKGHTCTDACKKKM